MRSYYNQLAIVCLTAIVVLLSACQKNEPPIHAESGLAKEFDAGIALQWNKVIESIDRSAAEMRAPISARALAYINLAAYEAGVNGMPNHNSFGNYYFGLELPKPPQAVHMNWALVVNAAYARSARLFYPTMSNESIIQVASKEDQFFRQFSKLGDVVVNDESLKYGLAIANAIYAWALTDPAGQEMQTQLYVPGYISNPNNVPGLWSPTLPDNEPALLPYWSQVRAFAIRDDDKLGFAPKVYSTNTASEMYAQATEIYNLTRSLSPEQSWMGQFWSDDVPNLTFTPAMRWMAIANQAVEIAEPSLEVALELYAKMGMALCDASIAAWHTKYYYNTERPIHYIRRNIDAGWQPPFAATAPFIHTPASPSYPSEQASLGAAGAEILTNMLGQHFVMTDNCHLFRSEFNGTPRSFQSFFDMARENADARMYLGMHFRMDTEEGFRLGSRAGRRVVSLPWRK